MKRKAHHAENRARSSSTKKIRSLELSEIIDIQTIQSIMDDCYKLIHIPISMYDLKGNGLVVIGWQDICAKFHRAHPEIYKHCIDTKVEQSTNIPPGEFKLQKCKYNMWNAATPIMVEDRQVGSVFAGQFFFEDEPLDYEFFRSQAKKYGFNEEEYISAIDKVPRLSREALHTTMAFFMTFANIISHLSYSNIKLFRSLAECEIMVDTLRKSEEKYRSIVETTKKEEEALKRAHDDLEKLVEERTVQLESAYESLKVREKGLAEAQKMAHIGNWDWNLATNELYYSDELYRIFGFNPQEFNVPLDAVLNYIHPEDREFVFNAVKEALNGKQYAEIDFRIITAEGKEGIIRAQGKVIFDENNIPIKIIGTAQNITESKKSEERIQTLANVVESSDDAIVTVSLDGVVTRWNKGAERVFGYLNEEILGRSISTIEPDGIKGETEQLSEKVRQGEKIHNFETSRLRKNCIRIVVSISLSPVFDIRGKLTAISVIARDITESKRAEEKLRENEEKYRSIVETANEGIIIIDDKAIITFANHKMTEMFGYDVEEGIGRSLWDYISYENRVAVEKNMEKWASRIIEPFELELTCKDGSSVCTLINAKPLFDKNGKDIGVLSMITDITNWKKAEEKIQRLANIVESSNDAIITGSPDGTIISWNKGAEQVYGYLAEEILGKNISITEPDNLKGEVKLLAEEVKQGKKIQHYETSRLRKDSTVINVSLTLSPIMDQSGKLVSISCIAGDITEKKKAEKLLQEKKMAEVANRTKNEFLAKISHELRTPLNSVIGFSDMLHEQAYGELNEKQLRVTGNISKSGKHLLSLINNILDISKIEAGKMELDYKNFELTPKLNMIQNILFPLANKKNIKIEIDIDNRLTSICADEDKFVQIMYNLVDNAIKFSHENSIIKITAAKKVDMMEITVEDTGTGINADDQYKLFKPFSQIYSFYSNKSQGTGLGLLLVKQIVQLHGGYVWYRSKPEEGSTFAFAIPIKCKSI